MASAAHVVAVARAIHPASGAPVPVSLFTMPVNLVGAVFVPLMLVVERALVVPIGPAGRDELLALIWFLARPIRVGHSRDDEDGRREGHRQDRGDQECSILQPVITSFLSGL